MNAARKTLLNAAVAAAFLPALAAHGAAALPAALPATLPAALAAATELAAMPDGGWLALDKHGLRLLDAGGKERARHAIRAKQLDTRSHAGGVLATVVDANTERALPLLVDLQGGRLLPQPALPAPAFGIEASCLYRDAQQLDQLFLIGKDGQGEQWLLHGEQRQLVRKLALPPRVKHCKVDDASATLLVSEEGMGLWAYGADPEGPPSRAALALRQPYGKLAGGAGALVSLPDGVAVADSKGQRLHPFRHDGGKWNALPPVALKGKADNLAARPAAGGVELLLNDEDAKRWQATSLAWKAPSARQAAVAIVQPRVQTEPMARLGDAADDPAIWTHASDPAAARVLGTNKKQGLLVYDLQGRQTQLLEVGRLNNVDVRQNVLLDGARYDLALATQRDDNVMMLFTIDAGGHVAEAARFPTGLDKIYGTCLYQPAGGGLEAFVNDKDGSYLHYRIERREGAFASTLLRRFKVASQPEGCAADDRNGRLFLGEERRGVWVTSADAARPDALRMVLPVGGPLQADVEGMALYHGAQASYLVVSSQGDNSYVVLDALPPYRVRGSFRIGYNVAAGIDGASETDGLDVTSANLGGAFGRGMLVVQDGYKRLPDGPQNFKYVAWDDVAKALKLP